MCSSLYGRGLCMEEGSVWKKTIYGDSLITNLNRDGKCEILLASLTTP